MSKHESRINGSASPQKSEAAREERLQALFAAADPPVKPSEALRQRVAEVTARHTPPASRREDRGRRGARSWTPLQIRLSLAGAAAVAFAALGVLPALVAAQAVRRLQAAVSDARSMHQAAWQINPDGSRTKMYELWYQGGRWRMETRRHGQIMLFAAGKLWTYDRQLNQLTVHPATEPFEYNPSGFSMAAMARDFDRWGWHAQIRLLEDITVAGRRVRQVTIEQTHLPERHLMLVDAATDLPIRIEVQIERDGKWTTQTLSEPRYNDPLPVALFEPNFPKSAHLVDPEHGRRDWEQRLQPGIARKHGGDRTIVIRDLQVNAEGDLFLLYTAGASPGDGWQDWSVDLTDQLGRRYLPSEGFQPYVRGGGSPGDKGYVFNGEKLEGGWWIPVVPQVPWKPCRFTLTFHVQPIAHHGPDPVPVENFAASTSFALTVDRPAATLAPAYMPYMGSGLDERGIRSREAKARAGYYRQSKDPRKLEKALALYREVLRLKDEQSQEIGQPVHDPQAWLDVGEVLRDLGRKEEARAALEEAVREEIYPNGVRKQAERGLKELQ